MSPKLAVLLAAGLLAASAAAQAQSPELRARHMRVVQLHATGHNAEAAAEARKALDLGVAEFGAEHPSTAALMVVLAKLRGELGEWPKAEALYRRAAAARAAALGESHPDTGEAHAGLGEALARQARFAEAEASYWDALHALGVEVARNVHVFDEVSVRAGLYRAWALYYRARVYVAEGRLAEADPLYQSAIAVFESNGSVDRTRIAAALGERAAVLRRLDRADEAAEIEAHAAAVAAGRASCPAGLFTFC